MGSQLLLRRALFAGLVALSILAEPPQAFSQNQARVSYSDGRLSVDATEVPLHSVLRTVAEMTGLEIFVSEDLQGERVTARVEHQPLEAALKRLLRRFSHAMTYETQDGSIALSSVKVYPQGVFKGPVVAVAPPPSPTPTAQSKAQGASERGAPAGDPEASGSLLPRSYTRQPGLETGQHAGASDAAGMAARLEFEERKAYSEIEDLKAKIAETVDPDQEEALELVLMEKIAEFQELQHRNRNKMESLRRIELFHQQSSSGK